VAFFGIVWLAHKHHPLMNSFVLLPKPFPKL
jgi:hypothetical protein